MGDGLVLEQGTHSDLIAAGGAYARLVQAQKLRENRENRGDSDNSSTDVEETNDIEKEAREEVPLGRKNTGHSLASEIIEQKKAAASTGESKEHDMGLFTLLHRMGGLVRDQRKKYLIGAVFACSKWRIWPATS